MVNETNVKFGNIEILKENIRFSIDYIKIYINEEFIKQLSIFYIFFAII